MSAWGANARSCKSLLDRVDRNDPNLIELFILPTKTFGSTDIERLAQTIEKGSNTHLKKLSASGHKLSNESLYNFGKAIASSVAHEQHNDGHSVLSSLAIGDNSMGHTGILAFTKGIKEGGGITRLEELDLSYKGIGTSGFDMILTSFDSTHCPKLRVLNLRRNENIGGCGMEDSDDGVTSSHYSCSFQSVSHLWELDLSQCGLSGGFVSKFFASLQHQQQQQQSTMEMELLPKLKKLYIQENPLEAKGLQALLPLITKTNSLLQELNISKCQINDEAIVKSLPTSSNTEDHTTDKHNNNLQRLDISYNDLTSAGAQHLSAGLSSPSSPLSNLMELNLAGNQLGEDGVQLLAAALGGQSKQQQQQQLEKLDLTNTNCGLRGAMDIITKGRLKTLYLFNNNLGASDGFITLASTLKGGHATLEHLDLGGNGANQASVVVLLGALLTTHDDEDEEGEKEEEEGGGPEKKKKNRLKVLVVGGNEGGDAVEQIVAKIRQVHPTLDIARDKKRAHSERQ